MAGLESKPAFKARALEIGMETQFFDDLAAAHVDTFGKMAFVCAANPTSGDDKPLKAATNSLINRNPDEAEILILRRLWFESHTIALADMKARVERTGAEAPRQMPLPERMERLNRQKAALQGIIIDAALEPSHGLVDKFQSMIEEGCMIYMPPDTCPSREAELAKEKSDHAINFDSQGNLKLTRKAVELSCDTGGELKLKAAFTRRSLAIDQTGVASYSVLEKWHLILFSALQRTPPAGHRFVSVQQLLAADKEYWTRVCQESRNRLQIVVGAQPPLDQYLERFALSPDVIFCLNPLPLQQRSSPYDSGEGKQKGQKGEQEGKGDKGKGKGKSVGQPSSKLSVQATQW